MIEVRLIKDNEKFKSVLITGHAGYANPGYDLVCASMSSLAMGLSNYLIEVEKIAIDDLNFYAIENEEASLLSINIEDPSIYNRPGVQSGFKFFEISILSLIQDYKDYLKLVYREV